MNFNKDLIREKHIWKDVEWGKREKNYNPKGKDPGNVWIPTNDNGKAVITEHILLNKEKVIKRLLDMSECYNDFKIYNTNLTFKGSTNVINKSKISGETKLLNTKEDTPQVYSGVINFGTSENMDTVKDGSIKTVVTSPPYWDLKDYLKSGQIGQESYLDYLQRLSNVWKQCYKKINENGSLWININTRVKNGMPILIPFDIINQCKKIGFYYKGIFIWHKSSSIPTNNKNISDNYEYVLVFSKNKNFSLKKQIQLKIEDYKNNNINGGTFWNINRKAGSIGKKFIHPAIYPNELVERIVELSSEENDFILDPF